MKVINCRSEEHANAYLAELDKQGYKWEGGKCLTVLSHWEKFKSETCYLVERKRVTYCNVFYFLKEGYEIEVYKGESK